MVSAELREARAGVVEKNEEIVERNRREAADNARSFQAFGRGLVRIAAAVQRRRRAR